nr:hypothetical protein [Tanacetum cinerariifolium]
MIETGIPCLATTSFRLCDLFDKNNLFIFDDESVRISSVSKMTFRKKPRDSLNVHSKRCSKHMTGNRALLTNFVEKFLGMVRFGTNDFAVIASYGDGLEIAFRKSTCFVRTEDGVDLLTGDRSSNLYTIALNEVASNSSTCLLAKAYSSQSWLWHQRLSHLNFATINNLVKNNLVQVNNQLNTEIFQRDTVSSSESAPTFAELFEINELKVQVQEKDTVILKLNEKLKSFSGDVKEIKVEKEVEEIETLNLEL